MKKFSKILAVVLAIAVIICPMMSVVSHAATAGTYKIELDGANIAKLTISSTDGFIAYDASVSFGNASDFQSSYNADGYTNGLKVISYTFKTAEENTHNVPVISANANGTALNVIVMPTDINNFDLYTEVVIGIRVADGTTASLTKIQAADDGDGTIASDPTLLTFPAAGSDGVIDTEADDYDEADAVAAPHVHTFGEYVSDGNATCAQDGTKTRTCSGCDATETVTDTGSHLLVAHTFGEYVSDGNATCAQDGTKTRTCSVCDATETVTDTDSHLSVAHTWGEYVSNNDATCTADGTKTRTCTVCSVVETVTDTGSMLNHSFTYTSNEDGTHTVGCANCDYSAQETCDTAGTDGACSKCGYKAAPAEPPVIDTITFTSKSIGLANTAIQFSFRVRQSILDAYANFDMVLVPNKYDTSTFNQVANPETVVIPKASWSIVGGGTKFYSYSYNDIQLYEVGLGIEYYIRVYDEGGNIIGTSAKTTVVPSEAAKALILSSSKPALQTAFTDLLVACNEAKKAFATAGSDLEAAEPFIDENDADGIIKYASKGDVDVSRLNVHDSFENQNDAFSTASSAAHRFVTTVSIAKVPVLNYRIKNNPSASDALDTSKLVMTISYTSTDGTEHEKVVSGDMWVQSGSYLAFAYDEVGLHDSSAVITAVCTYDGAAAFTKEYNFDTHYSTRMSSGASAAMFTAFAKLGLSFPATMA